MKNKHSQVLSYAGALFLVILSVLAIVVTIFVFKGQQSYDENTISVTGSAEISGNPDIARFSFEVSELADNPEDAQEVISEKISKILDGLESLDIEQEDIKTDSYSINPKYDWVKLDQTIAETAPDGTQYFPGNDRKQVLIGYDVRQNVTVLLRDLDQSGEALRLFAQQGVEKLYGPSFEIEDPDSLQEQARLEAIGKAKEKAKRLAKNLDVRLGKIISFNEGNNGFYPEPYLARSEMASISFDMAKEYSPELPTGQQDISSTVTITYKIK